MSVYIYINQYLLLSTLINDNLVCFKKYFLNTTQIHKFRTTNKNMSNAIMGIDHHR